MPIDASRMYLASLYARRTHADDRQNAIVMFVTGYDRALTPLSPSLTVIGATPPDYHDPQLGQWTRYQGHFGPDLSLHLPDGTAYIRVAIWDMSGQAGAVNQVDAVDLRPAISNAFTFPVCPEGVFIPLWTNVTGYPVIAPGHCRIVKAFAYATAPPQGQAIIFNIKKNTSYIWTDAHRLQIAAGQNQGTQTVFDTDTLDEGDRLTLDVLQTGSTTTEGQGVVVMLKALQG